SLPLAFGRGPGSPLAPRPPHCSCESSNRVVGLLRRLAIARCPLPSAGAPARRSRRYFFFFAVLALTFGGALVRTPGFGLGVAAVFCAVFGFAPALGIAPAFGAALAFAVASFERPLFITGT